jgi:hypothetical protein
MQRILFIKVKYIILCVDRLGYYIDWIDIRLMIEIDRSIIYANQHIMVI